MPGAARKIDVVTPKQPEQTPKIRKVAYNNPYIKKKYILMIGAAVWMTVLAFLVINSNTRLTAVQIQSQKLNSSITQITNDNVNKKQEISELSSRSRLDKIAKEAGMTIDEQKIRNVTK